MVQAAENTNGLLRVSVKGPEIGEGNVHTDLEFHLSGNLTFFSEFGEEDWTFEADAVYIVKAMVDGPFRGHYEGWATRVDDGTSMALIIEADFVPSEIVPLALDGHNAWFYFEGKRKKDNFKAYFDGRSLLK
jgi:hypothetical protein